MLTQEQFYITSLVKQQVFDDQESYFFNLGLTEGIHPYYDFALYELENHPRLELSLNLMSAKQKFLIHSYYFLLNQMKFLESQDVQSSIAFEVASDDLIKIYQTYNAQPIEINGDLFDF